MSIISLEMKNFTSYKYQKIDTFSKNLNLIIGKNGHGKSNLLNGINIINNSILIHIYR